MSQLYALKCRDLAFQITIILVLLLLTIGFYYGYKYSSVEIVNVIRKQSTKEDRKMFNSDVIQSTSSCHRNSTDRKIRIALIKPDSIPGLYHGGYGDESIIIEKASKHWGPIGLFHTDYFHTDYFVILVDHNDTSTSQWVEPVVDCFSRKLSNMTLPIVIPPRPIEGYFATGVFRSSSVNVTSIARVVTSIDWDEYDVVMSFSPAISPDIIRKHPSTIWAYWIVEGCQRSYRQSRQGNIVHGWDLFLTQDFNLYTELPKNVIEFPLVFDYHGGLFDLLSTTRNYSEIYSRSCFNDNEILNSCRSGILLLPSKFNETEKKILENVHYMDSTNRTRVIDVDAITGNTIASMRLHLRRKYAIIWGRTSRGNAIGEALSAGLLVLGDSRAHIINKEILRMTRCEFPTLDLLIKHVIKLEMDDHLFSIYLNQQRKLFDMLAFFGPFRQLREKGLAIVNRKMKQNNSTAMFDIMKKWSRTENIFSSLRRLR